MRTRSHYLLRWPGEWLRKDGAAGSASPITSAWPRESSLESEIELGKPNPFTMSSGKFKAQRFPMSGLFAAIITDGW